MFRTGVSVTVGPILLAWAWIVLLLVHQSPVQSQTLPSNSGPRQSVSLDGTWKLSPPLFSQTQPAKPAADAEETARGFDDSSWQDVAVPGDWFGLFWEHWKVDVPPQKPNFIDAWYRYRFSVPADLPPGRRILRFDAVDYIADIYINGSSVGRHVGTWSPFEFDVTDHVLPGVDNVIAVHVTMDVPNFGGGLEHARGYRARKMLQFNLGGIHQSVQLDAVPETHVANVLIDPRVNERRVDVGIEVTGAKRAVAASAEVRKWPAKPGDAAVVTSKPLSIKAEDPQRLVHIQLPADGLKTWSPDSPELYLLRTTLTADDGSIIDVKEDRFGYRQFEARPEGFLLNGLPVYPFGECIVWVDKMDRGQGNPKWIRQYVQTLKENNYTFLRLHADPCPRWIIDICDEEGLMLMPEWGHGINPDEAQEFSEMRDWMLSLYNAPSVVMWSLRNESSETVRDARMFRRIRAVDKTSRPMTATAGGNLFEPPTVTNTDIYDTHLYYGTGGYPMSFMVPAYEYLHKKAAGYPGGGGRPFILTEANLVRGGDINRAVPDERFPELSVDQYLNRAAELGPSDPDKQAKLMPLSSINSQTEEMPSWQGAQFVKKLIETFRIRDDLLQGIIPWQAYVSQGRHNFQPVFVGTDLNYANKAEFAGAVHRFTVHLRSVDRQQYAACALDLWIEDLQGRKVCDVGSLEIGQVAPGTRLDKPFEWTIPDATASGDYLLRLAVRDGERVISRNLYELYILGRADQAPRVDAVGPVAVLRPRGLPGPSRISIPQILDQLKVKYTVVNDLKSLKDYGVLIVPPFYGKRPLERKPILGAAMAFILTEERNAFTKLAERDKVRWEDVYPEITSAAKPLQEWLAAGGRIVAFEQFVTGPVPWLPESKLVDSGFNNFVDPVRRDHPAFAGLMIRDFADWEQELGVIVDYSIEPLNKDVIAAVCTYGYAGNPGGMRMAIAESPIGAGLSILSQVNTVRRYGQDAVATRYVNQLLRYTLGNPLQRTDAPATQSSHAGQ